jgi:hypothetical protein
MIERNTVIQTGHILISDYAPNTRFKFRNNISRHNEYGVFGSGQGTGFRTLDFYFPGYVFAGNVIAKEVNAPSSVESLYPTGNYFPASLTAVGFVDLVGKDYRLATSSPYKGKGTDGKDPGADIDALAAAQGGASTPTPLPEPTPTPTPSPTPSPTPAPGSTVTDSTGGMWTFGPNKETLRNNVHMGGGQGTRYKLFENSVYTLGLDSNWYKWEWEGSYWRSVGTAEPGVTQPTPQPTPTPTPMPEPTPAPAVPRILLYPSSESGQTALWQAQAKEGYRPNRHVARPSGAPKGQYVEFVKW